VTKHMVDGRIEVLVNNKTFGIDPCRGTGVGPNHHGDEHRLRAYH
jgi:hypothetical protein